MALRSTRKSPAGFSRLALHQARTVQRVDRADLAAGRHALARAQHDGRFIARSEMEEVITSNHAWKVEMHAGCETACRHVDLHRMRIDPGHLSAQPDVLLDGQRM